MEWHRSRVLVTGGAGCIGSALSRRLVLAGADVTIVDSLLPQYGGNLHNIRDFAARVRLNVSDVRDAHSMRHLVRGVDVVFNLAGQTSHLDSMHNPLTDLEINATAQLSILETLRLHNPSARVVFASTRQIYGRPEYLPVDEHHPLRPIDVNGINKLAGESYHLLYHQVYGMQTCALRLTNTYGPGMRIKDDRQTFIGIWIRRLIEGRPFEVWDGGQRRDFNYREDVVDALLLAASQPAAIGCAFNLGSAEVVTLRQVADMLVELHPGGVYEVRDFPQERRSIDIGDHFSDFSLIEQTLGWRPRTPLRDGMIQTIDYFREHSDFYIR
ncbi:MAG: SDR family NAD(P)-dependent oxidoreductase [Cyanobium sp.]